MISFSLLKLKLKWLKKLNFIFLTKWKWHLFNLPELFTNVGVWFSAPTASV